MTRIPPDGPPHRHVRVREVDNLPAESICWSSFSFDGFSTHKVTRYLVSLARIPGLRVETANSDANNSFPMLNATKQESRSTAMPAGFDNPSKKRTCNSPS